MRSSVVIAILIFLISCSSTKELPPLETVKSVDINRFMGDWYVIANIPTFLEKGAHNAVENYQWNEKENRIDVNFTFNKDNYDGEKKTLTQKAFIYNEKTKAEWRIQLFWPIKFPYLIIDLAPDYSFTVIGVPERSYVWIMSRTPVMDENIYQKIIKSLGERGFDLSLIQKVPQKVLR